MASTKCCNGPKFSVLLVCASAEEVEPGLKTPFWLADIWFCCIVCIARGAFVLIHCNLIIGPTSTFFNANGGILKFEVDCPELASLGSICENKAEHDLEVVVRVRSLELRECVDGVQSIRLVLMWRQV